MDSSRLCCDASNSPSGWLPAAGPGTGACGGPPSALFPEHSATQSDVSKEDTAKIVVRMVVLIVVPWTILCGIGFFFSWKCHKARTNIHNTKTKIRMRKKKISWCKSMILPFITSFPKLRIKRFRKKSIIGIEILLPSRTLFFPRKVWWRFSIAWRVDWTPTQSFSILNQQCHCRSTS